MGSPNTLGTPSEIKITRSQELIYELRIGDVMMRRIISVSPEQTMHDVKEILRLNRISGVPVLDGGELVGIVSVENIIKALERGEIETLVKDKMTTKVDTVTSEEPVINAIRKFGKHGYGRLPVTDKQGELVGIVTGTDIIQGLLRAIEEDFHRQEKSKHESSSVFREVISEQTMLTLRYVVDSDLARGGEASSRIKKTLVSLGTEPEVTRRVAIAAYEAETNLIIHAGGGEMMAEIQPHQIRIVGTDRGPGISDIDQAMQVGFSTAPEWIREQGFGAGMGLANIKKCADIMNLKSTVGEGTTIEIIVGLS